ncbi:preprotein translocase subunit SecE [Kingella kingae]|uniref:preprotein translocase subunit SecE n=1 Tax=Kingella kingae TaxID=504 RepID=UPI003D6EDA4C
MSQKTEHEQESGFRLFRYIKESFKEFKKVVWPKRNDAVQITIFVIVFVIIFALFIFGVDTIIVKLFGYLNGY